MAAIHDQNIQMRPKIYYIFASALLFVSLVLSVITSVFLFSLTRFSLKVHGPMGQLRLEQLFFSFPWWAPLLAIVGVIVSIWILRKYDFSYKFNFKVLVITLVFAVIAAGWAIDYLNLDDVWFRQGPMRGIMRQYMRENGIQSGQGWGRK